jgi:hypothetical protein
VGAVGAGASLFEGRHLVLSATINLREEQPAGAGQLKGLANLVELSGATTPRAGAAPIKAATRVGGARAGRVAGARGRVHCVELVPGCREVWVLAAAEVSTAPPRRAAAEEPEFVQRRQGAVRQLCHAARGA